MVVVWTDAPGHKATAVLVALQVPARAGHQIAHARPPPPLPCSSSDPAAGLRLPRARAPAAQGPLSSRVRTASAGPAARGNAAEAGPAGRPWVAEAEMIASLRLAAPWAWGLLVQSFPLPTLSLSLSPLLCFLLHFFII